MTTSEQRKINEIKHGEKIAKNAEKVWGHSKKAGQLRVKRRVDLMVELGKITRESKVLELGCGTGEFSKLLAETGANLTGVDLSPDLLDLAKEKLKNYPNVNLLIDDIEVLGQVTDNTFDNIVGNSILHHVNYEESLKKSYAKLKTGGSIFFSEPNMVNPQIAIQKNIPFIKKIMGDSPDEIAFFRWKVESLLKKIGYKNVVVKNFDFLHPVFPDSLTDLLEVPLKSLEKIPVIKEISGSIYFYGEK